jgi:hypothetical protein
MTYCTQHLYIPALGLGLLSQRLFVQNKSAQPDPRNRSVADQARPELASGSLRKRNNQTGQPTALQNEPNFPRFQLKTKIAQKQTQIKANL